MMEMSLLYGEMMASWIVHLAIPFAVSLLIGFAFPTLEALQKTLVLLGLTVLLSFIAQTGFLTGLQASSCGGVQAFDVIGLSALVAAALTTVMTAIPLFIEFPRLAVSQLFVKHEPLLTDRGRQVGQIVEGAATGLSQLMGTQAQAQGQQGGFRLLTQEEYSVQTFNEQVLGAMYFAAFAGAYGVAGASLWVAKCQAPAAPAPAPSSSKTSSASTSSGRSEP